jgi:predicted pyridoxine 5'-phosphate oxidase superfamily flavin-nucleotide-binding protein
MNTETIQDAVVSTSPFHPGERAVQSMAGVREEAEKRGQRMLTAELNPPQREFFRQLPFLVSAHTDEHGQPWAGLITGEPGFIAVEEDRNQCAVHWDRASNPTGVAVRAGDTLGLLGIELATRRRNRLNTTVFANEDQQWRMLIDQGYGNCPKYINERPWPADLFAGTYQLQDTEGLSAAAQALAAGTDTFFIATSSGPAQPDQATRASAWGTDVSHRGGDPGFLRTEKDRLVFEDYPGNNMFNTLGNIVQHPFCGLLILDFHGGDILQLAASADLVQAGDERKVELEILTTRHWRAADRPAQEQH